jgi:hypothetical protein
MIYKESLLQKLTMTLDTNTLGRIVFSRIEGAIIGLPIELGHISVTAREQRDAYSPLPGECIPESAICGESICGNCVVDSGVLFEKLLKIIGHGSFPIEGKRENFSHGQRNQLRDAMILTAHVRSGRDIFVTNEKRAFVGKDGSRRQELEYICTTKIMNIYEFSQYCDALRAGDNQ